jgi:hypothetical protein
MLGIFEEAVMSSTCLRLAVVFTFVFTLACGTPGVNPNTSFGTHFSPPALTKLEPNTVPVNSTPFVLTVNGQNFGADSTVFWNSVPQRTMFVSATQLQVSITADDLMTFGLIQVHVQTAGQTSNTVTFDVTAQ